MDQPSSSYHHGFYGLFIEGSPASLKFIGRLSYYERPTFRASGYRDQDAGYFVHVGTRLATQGAHGFYAFAGYGHLTGFIESTSGNLDFDTPERRTFRKDAFTTTMEYRYSLKHISMQMGHQLAMGIGDHRETAAYVAWPYSFFYLGLGILL